MNDWFDKLQEQLAGELPGSRAHALMSPAGRGNTEEYIKELVSPPKNSAVLLLLYPAVNSIKMVLIKRPSYDGVHSGQIALPGGKVEDTDTDYQYTALRETSEEIGVDTHDIKMLGSLSRIYIPPSNFLVYPFVGWMNNIPSFKPDPKEVDLILSPNINVLLEDSVRKEGSFMAGGSKGFMVKAPYFEVENEKVWGATAAILSEFKEILKQLKF